jgi:hypothetical protein
MFGEYSGDSSINRVEFLDVVHLPMLYARVRVGAREFTYLPFNGMIYDL